MAELDLKKGQAFTILRKLGWRIRTENEGRQAIAAFQAAYAMGAALKVDGRAGPKTSAALLRSYAALKEGRNTASPHFSFTEFRCKCGGRYSSCRRIWVKRKLILSLESYRRRVGAVAIVSGCRCPSHNKAVGGVKGSQHMQGTAVDVHYVRGVTDSTIKQWEIFAGLGRSARTHQVRHLDRRDIGQDTTGGTCARPTVWNYAR